MERGVGALGTVLGGPVVIGLREIRRLPEATVIERWLALHRAGKHQGKDSDPHAERFTGLDGTWVEVEIPHEHYSADWNVEPDAPQSAERIARSARYASAETPLPPGMALFNGRRKRRAFIADGNHRAYAAFLRGDSAARFYMPLSHWTRFRAAIG